MLRGGAVSLGGQFAPPSPPRGSWSGRGGVEQGGTGLPSLRELFDYFRAERFAGTVQPMCALRAF